MDALKTYCKSCKRETNHGVRGEYKPEPKDDYDLGRSFFNEYRIVQCLGCDHIGFVNTYWDSDDIHENGPINKFERHFPEDPDYLCFYSFLNEEEQCELPGFLCDMYSELKITFQNDDINILCGIGLRMVVEAACLHQKVLGDNLKRKIENLLENGLISRNDYAIIDRLREMGNTSAHEMKSLSQSDLDAALEAVNHLLRILYVVSKRTKRLRKSAK